MSPTAWRTLPPGLLLGYTISRLGFGDYAELHRMLLFRDLRLLLAFATAVGCSLLLFRWQRACTETGRALEPHLCRRSAGFHSGIIPGAALFGVGWALTGACPGVALIQIGQGQLPALASFLGILTGIYLENRWVKPSITAHERKP